MTLVELLVAMSILGIVLGAHRAAPVQRGVVRQDRLSQTPRHLGSPSSTGTCELRRGNVLYGPAPRIALWGRFSGSIASCTGCLLRTPCASTRRRMPTHGARLSTGASCGKILWADSS